MEERKLNEFYFEIYRKDGFNKRQYVRYLL